MSINNPSVRPSILQNALRFKRAELQAELDEKLKADGWTTVYAVDASVVFAFIDATSGVPIAGSQHCDLIPKSTATNASSITTAAYDNLLGELGTTGKVVPLILLTGHASELRQHLERSTYQFTKTPMDSPKIMMRLLDAIAKEVHKREKKSRNSVSSKQRVASLRVQEILHEHMYAQQKFSRLSNLIARQKILGRSAAATHPALCELAKVEGQLWLDKPDTPSDLSAETWLTNEDKLWLDDIKPGSHHESWTSDYNAIFDSLILNRSGIRQKMRVVLITNSPRIVSCCEQYRFVDEALPDDLTYCDYFIRPMEYFSEELIATGFSHENHWTEGLLAPIYDNEIKNLKKLNKDHAFLYTANREYPRSDTEFDTEIQTWLRENSEKFSRTIGERSTWQRYTKSLDEYLDDLPKDQEIEAIVGDITRIIDDHAEKARSGFIESLAASGYALWESGAKSSNYGSRSLPSLIFQADLTAASEFEKLLAEFGASRAWRSEVKNLAYSSRTVINEHSSSGYLVLLMYAVLYAADNNWATCGIIARQAINLAKVLGSDSQITGREATFLCAVSVRLTAREKDDLKQSHELLDAAESILAKDISHGRDLNGARFHAERLNLWIAEILFDAFEEKPDVESLTDQIKKAFQFAKSTALTLAQECNLPDAKVNCKIGIRSSIISLLVAAHKLNIELCDPFDWSKFAADQLADLKHYYRAVRIDDMPIRDIILVSTLLSLKVDTQKWNTMTISGFGVPFTDFDMNRACIAPYDKRRFKYCQSLIDAKLESSEL